MAKANNPFDSYVRVTFTPREAKIVSMILNSRFSGPPVDEIAHYFAITTERVNQIIKKSQRKIDCARAKMATEAERAKEVEE